MIKCPNCDNDLGDICQKVDGVLKDVLSWDGVVKAYVSSFNLYPGQDMAMLRQFICDINTKKRFYCGDCEFMLPGKMLRPATKTILIYEVTDTYKMSELL